VVFVCLLIIYAFFTVYEINCDKLGKDTSIQLTLTKLNVS
jgi:hypothetical protein